VCWSLVFSLGWVGGGGGRIYICVSVILGKNVAVFCIESITLAIGV
jgi:hypothetical protein